MCVHMYICMCVHLYVCVYVMYVSIIIISHHFSCIYNQYNGDIITGGFGNINVSLIVYTNC